MIETEFILNTIRQFLRILNIALRKTFPSLKVHTLAREREKKQKHLARCRQAAGLEAERAAIAPPEAGVPVCPPGFTPVTPPRVTQSPRTGQAYGQRASTYVRYYPHPTPPTHLDIKYQLTKQSW